MLQGGFFSYAHVDKLFGHNEDCVFLVKEMVFHVLYNRDYLNSYGKMK